MFLKKGNEMRTNLNHQTKSFQKKSQAEIVDIEDRLEVSESHKANRKIALTDEEIDAINPHTISSLRIMFKRGIRYAEEIYGISQNPQPSTTK